MKNTLRIFLFVIVACPATAQDFYAQWRDGWLQKAANIPVTLQTVTKAPVTLVALEKDAAAFQGWKAVPSKPMDSLFSKSFKKQSGVVVDFGEHLTGNFTFALEGLRGTSDAPTRFKLTFGEVPAELATAFDPYPGGLSRAWLQDEVITVRDIPATVTLERRVAFRYVKIELLGSSGYFDFKIAGMSFAATTSAPSKPDALAAGTDPLIKQIDAVGLKTLQECMQTVYEDGPKRDRRLWIGDLYLESIANSYSFKNHNLTRHCLYLLAALSRHDGILNSNCFEYPKPHPQEGIILFDYTLLYNVALKEYLVATGDKETALDLWPVAKKQLENIKRFMTPDGMFDVVAAQKERWWLFVDWKDGLDKQAPINGIIIYSLRETMALAKLLGKEGEIGDVPAQIKKMSAASRKNLLNTKTGLFESGPDKQISYASQAWMVLADVATPAEGQKALHALPSMGNAVHPGAPYLFHYYAEAMIHCGMKTEAREAIVGYWGGMVKKGADTFWEVYDSANDYLSPYGFFPINSYCHAWSCTPVYFIRKYPEIFQK